MRENILLTGLLPIYFSMNSFKTYTICDCLNFTASLFQNKI